MSALDGVPRVLVLAASPPTIQLGPAPPATFVVSSFGDPEMPSVVEFDYLFAEIPGEGVDLARWETELRHATQAGLSIVWFVAQGSAEAILEALTGSDVLRLRTPPRPQVVEPHFAPYFALPAQAASCSFSLLPSEGWRPIATLRGRTAVAVMRPTVEGGAVVVLPCGGGLGGEQARAAYECLQAAAAARRPEVVAASSVRRVVAGLLLLAALVTVVRYEQRVSNVDLAELSTSNFAYRDWPHDTELTREKMLADLLRLEPSDAWSPAQVREHLRLLSYAHLHLQEARVLAFLLQKSAHGWAPRLAAQHMQGRIVGQLREALERGSYGEAHYHAQRFLNLADQIPVGPEVEELQEAMNLARKTVLLTRGVYVYADRTAVEFMVAVLLTDGERAEAVGRRLAADPRGASRTVDPKTGESRRYFETVARAREEAAIGPRTLWQALAEEYPDGRWRAEIDFNALTSLMNSTVGLDLDDPGKLAEAVQASRLALGEARAFASRHAGSYLADDALRHALRLAFALGDRGGVGWAYRELAVRYRQADAFKRVQAGLEDWIYEVGKASREVARAGARLLEESARHPPGSRPAEVVGEERGLGAHGLRAVQRAMAAGDGAVAAGDVRELVEGALMEWLRAHGDRQGVQELAPSARPRRPRGAARRGETS